MEVEPMVKPPRPAVSLLGTGKTLCRYQATRSQRSNQRRRWTKQITSEQ